MSETCYFFKFLLFVTGESEKEHLPKMFDSLASSGICSFTVNRRLGQRDPVKSETHLAQMVRTGQKIPNKDFNQIGASARRLVDDNACHYIILMDDLEHSRTEDAPEVFLRYRNALDAALLSKKYKASVHFLVNMLEAYFWADPDALNRALGLEPPVLPLQTDVESIRNPKAELKRIFPAYHEITHSGLILDLFDLEVVLSNENTCGWLRSCVKWIADVLANYPDGAFYSSLNLSSKYLLETGKLSEITSKQPVRPEQ